MQNQRVLQSWLLNQIRNYLKVWQQLQMILRRPLNSNSNFSKYRVLLWVKVRLWCKVELKCPVWCLKLTITTVPSNRWCLNNSKWTINILNNRWCNNHKWVLPWCKDMECLLEDNPCMANNNITNRCMVRIRWCLSRISNICNNSNSIWDILNNSNNFKGILWLVRCLLKEVLLMVPQ